MKIWIGGSSGLAQTYFNTFPIIDVGNDEATINNNNKNKKNCNGIDHESWILIGCERTPPTWILQLQQQQQQQQQKEGKVHYIYCDLCQLLDHSVTDDHDHDDDSYDYDNNNNNNNLQRVMNDIRLVMEKSLPSIVNSNNNNNNNNHHHHHHHMINSIIVGIRPPLITYRTNEIALQYNNSMVNGLHILLQHIIEQYIHSIRVVIHISSIAAINHITKQHLRSTCIIGHTTTTTTTIIDPSYTELQYPYDRFKRQCEMMIEQLIQAIHSTTTTTTTTTNNNHPKIQYTNLRLGAIFSDDSTCIQCTSLFIQLLCFGPYLPTYIDCNSSYNVCQLLHEMLLLSCTATTPSSSSSSSSSLRPIYYYTRCVSQYPYPVPYGEYLLSYKRVYYGTILAWFVPLLVPHVFIEYGVVRLFHYWTIFLQWIHSQCRRHCTVVVLPLLPLLLLPPPYMESIDYLLQVTLNEHTFDMKETIQDFPNLLQLEETMEECFRRRRFRKTNH